MRNRKFIGFLFLFFNIICFSQLCSYSKNSIDKVMEVENDHFNKNNESCDGKLYLDLSAVIITSNGIFVNLNEQLFPIDNINSDVNGFYTYLTHWTPCFDDDWKCVRGHWNPQYETRCVTCGVRMQPDPPRWKDYYQR